MDSAVVSVTVSNSTTKVDIQTSFSILVPPRGLLYYMCVLCFIILRLPGLVSIKIAPCNIHHQEHSLSFLMKSFISCEVETGWEREKLQLPGGTGHVLGIFQLC